MNRKKGLETEMGVLTELEPKSVFQFFEELCQIPHGSGNCQAISNYLVDFAKKRNLQWQQDEMHNVIIIKEATAGYEQEEPYVIQGHMDMVAVKKADCDIDLMKDGLRLKVDGDRVYAEGTTLGGDDGIAVAFALAIMDASDLKHPRIEAIFTTEEEVGMEGASALDPSICKGRRLLNLDSEEEGILLTSCAGGCRAHVEISVGRENKTGTLYKIQLDNMFGGHSGTEIDKEHGNAIKLLGRVVYMLSKVSPVSLVESYGGGKDNAIPRDAYAVIMVNDQDNKAVENAFEEIRKAFHSEYATKEPSMTCEMTKMEDRAEKSVVTSEKTIAIAKYLLAIPNGIQHMSIDIEGLVETSLNVGIMELKEDVFTTDSAIRSSIEIAKMEVKEQMAVIAELSGGSISYHGEYPGWQYNPDSELRKKMLRIFKEMFGKEAEVQALHAGLECGILCEKLPGLDCVSFGPDIFDIHTTEEQLSISSTKRMWDYVVRILAEKS